VSVFSSCTSPVDAGAGKAEAGPLVSKMLRGLQKN
jgi:hypothetical protein